MFAMFVASQKENSIKTCKAIYRPWWHRFWQWAVSSEPGVRPPVLLYLQWSSGLKKHLQLAVMILKC